ncbi:MAG: InlB B-repeat-containing protein [Acutalibacteraceae bacterium]|nr:InlB B-repeat-containing protein [Acutalibacteraceae bacterium]
MVKKKMKKLLSLLLVLCILCSISCVGFTVDADDTVTATTIPLATPTVEIVSFVRGAQEDLRSSELLEARVTGYDGNVRELTYKWESTLGTYLYVYNSHNMYHIDGTDNEVEIYNDQVPASNNMAGRSYKDSYSGKGYCWAAIYGSNYSGASSSISDEVAFNGTIKVTVYDPEGNIIATDSHTGEVTKVDRKYYYNGIVDHSIQKELDNVTIGLFEGDTRNVKDLLGESAIVHITCTASSVTSGRVVSGGNNIKLTKSGDYYITGVKAGTSTDSDGDARVQLSVRKTSCKFHSNSSGTATTTVYVFKKPTTSTTAHSLTLVSGLDDRCRYFIDGREGIRQVDGTILFDGLNPNTEYMVEVRAEYKDEENNTRYTYAYVKDTTKPVYNAVVEVYLDGTYNSSTNTATGTKINLEDVSPYATVYAKSVDGAEFIELKKKEGTVGTYTSTLDTGSYNLYYSADNSTMIDDQLLVMNHADCTRYIFYNSVTYKDGEQELNKEYYLSDSAVNVWAEVPEKEGYVFTGWKDTDGNIYKGTDQLTKNISTPYVLEAQWEESVDVYVNITIDHTTADGSGVVENDKGMHNISYDLMTKLSGTVNYSDMLTKSIEWDGESAFTEYGYTATYEDDKTVYKAILPVAENVLKSSVYTVEIAKTEYELYEVSTGSDESGNVIIDAKLRHKPSNNNFVFSVELDEEAKKLPAEILPVAAHVKVNCWYDSMSDDYEITDWFTITQHEETFVTVPLDENGRGQGSYPVWCQTTNGEKYFYRIEVVSYLLPDGNIIPAKDGTQVENSDVSVKHTEYFTADKRYHAKIEVTDGKEPAPDTALKGAYFEGNSQTGNVKAVISVNTHNVTFQPDGGSFADGVTDDKVTEKQLVVPDLSNYTVTKAGGYVFDGWYVVEDDVMTDKTVSGGDELLGDIVLRARWKEPLTIQGIVSVAGYHYLDDEKTELRVIDSIARTHTVSVYLQKIMPNGYPETIQTQIINIAYNDQGMMEVDKPMGTGNYCFTAIPDEGFEYRILIQNPNYNIKYQNEPYSIDFATMLDYDGWYFDESQGAYYNAVFGETEPLVAAVNAFMEYKRLSFDLHYAVDATRINDGYRPDTTDVSVLYNDLKSGDNPQGWPVIVPMENNGNNPDHEVVIDSVTAKGQKCSSVWRTMPDGHTLYDYGVRLDDYTINGETTAYNSAEAPFNVYYNGSARYSAIEGLTPPNQTQLLTVELHPKTYQVIFDINFTETEDDYVSGMDGYAKETDDKIIYHTGHIWSYTTDISDVIPTRKGCEFLGWYDKNGNPVTEIDASVHEDVTVTARWSYKVTFHANNEDIDYDVFRNYYTNDVTVSGENNFNLNTDCSLESFYDIPEFEYLTHNKYVFKGWYMDEDDDSRPINWNEIYTGPTDVYAHWILVEDVEKESGDKKLYDNSGKYMGYDLLGVQIRDVQKDNQQHYGNEGTGLRFVTVLSEDVYAQINALSTKNAGGAEYGYALAKTATAQAYAGDTQGYQLNYKGTNVNGKNTAAEYKYIQNIKCSGVPDHFNGNSYRLYTAVVTYKNLEGEALAKAHSQEIVARAYIRYTDANGLLRTHYNNYTGTNTYHGCSSSFDLANALMNS